MSNEWYYTQEDEPVGPISAQQLKQLSHDGAITADSLVWKSGMAQWKLAAAVKGLFESAPPLPASPPPLPQPGEESVDSVPAETFSAPISTRPTPKWVRSSHRKMNAIWVAVGGTSALAVLLVITIIIWLGGNGESNGTGDDESVAGTKRGEGESAERVEAQVETAMNPQPLAETNGRTDSSITSLDLLQPLREKVSTKPNWSFTGGSLVGNNLNEDSFIDTQVQPTGDYDLIIELRLGRQNGVNDTLITLPAYGKKYPFGIRHKTDGSAPT